MMSRTIQYFQPYYYSTDKYNNKNRKDTFGWTEDFFRDTQKTIHTIAMHSQTPPKSIDDDEEIWVPISKLSKSNIPRILCFVFKNVEDVKLVTDSGNRAYWQSERYQTTKAVFIKYSFFQSNFHLLNIDSNR